MLVARVIFPLYSALKSKVLKALETQDAAAQSREVTDVTTAETANKFCHVISSGFDSCAIGLLCRGV